GRGMLRDVQDFLPERNDLRTRMNHAAIEHLCGADRTLARLIRRVGPCRLKPKNRRSHFEALVHAVTHQQLNGTAAATILKRVLAIYRGKRFPSPEDLHWTPDEQLRAAGLSRAKTAALKDIAAKTIAGIVPTSRAIRLMENAEILERLTSV